MTAEQQNEEAHGLWELAVARLAALVEAGAKQQFVTSAVTNERSAFFFWQETLRRILEKQE